MKFSREDWRKIQLALVVFFLVLISAVLLFSYEQHRKHASLSSLLQHQQALTQATNRYIKSGEEKVSIIQHLPRYQRLVNQGAVGEEHRIEWVDALRNTHKDNKLFSIKFAIGVQSPYPSTLMPNVEPFKPYHSLMKIELSLLHENDLLVLLDSLGQKNLSPFILQQCEMTRQNANISNSLTANIQAKCDLDWITLHEPLRH